MILPTKRLSIGRSVLAVGADILQLLNEPKTVSRLWDELKSGRAEKYNSQPITYDWFVLGLDLLYMMNAIEQDHGRVQRVTR